LHHFYVHGSGIVHVLFSF